MAEAKQFKKLEISDHWHHKLIKYPGGYTILENLIDWVSKTNLLITNVNDWNEYLHEFVEQFDKKLEPTVITTLYDMAADGTLDRIINENIFTDLNNKIDGTQADVDTLNLETIPDLDSRKVDKQFESVTYYIPTDFPDIKAAINKLSEKKFKDGVIIDLMIVGGHEIEEPILLENGDYSHFRISSELSQVNLFAGFPKENFLVLRNCRGPIINTVFNGRGLCKNGIYVDSSASVVVNRSCGFINAGTTNLYVRGSGYAYAEGGIFTGGSQDGGGEETGGAGIVAWGGTVFAQEADVSNSNTYGAQAAHGGRLSFHSGKANNCGRHGVRATNGAFVDARNSQANNAGVHGYYSLSGSILNCYGGSAKNCGGNGIYASQAAIVNARECDVSGSNAGILAERNSSVDFYMGVADDCMEFGLRAVHVSSINAFGARVVGTKSPATGHGVIALMGSKVSIQGGVIQDSGGYDAYVDNGGQIFLTSARTTGSTTNNPKLEDTNVSAFDTFESIGCIWW